MPTLAFATTRQCDVLDALQVFALMTSTTWLSVLHSPVGHWIGTYSVPVLGFTAGIAGLPTRPTELPRRSCRRRPARPQSVSREPRRA